MVFPQIARFQQVHELKQRQRVFPKQFPTMAISKG
jgi:hypothetical protein